MPREYESGKCIACERYSAQHCANCYQWCCSDCAEEWWSNPLTGNRIHYSDCFYSGMCPKCRKIVNDNQEEIARINQEYKQKLDNIRYKIYED
jgi:hypothetical protein